MIYDALAVAPDPLLTGFRFTECVNPFEPLEWTGAGVMVGKERCVYTGLGDEQSRGKYMGSGVNISSLL